VSTLDATELTVLYDERCAFCIRCRDWLASQPVLVPVELLGAGTDEARRRFPDVEVRGSELVVVDEQGQTWIGSDAFVMCLWATARYRSLAMRLTRPGWAPFAGVFFHQLSMRRDTLSAWVGPESECEACNDLDLWWETP
jgi:predicted DCC family thiol-disulfide oxidoreductase YuxK